MEDRNTLNISVDGVQRIRRNSKNVIRKVPVFGYIILEVIVLILRILFSICESMYRVVSPKEPKSVKGEIVLITGSGHGIGRQLAYLYAAEGATVVGWDVNAKDNAKTIETINELGYTKAYSYVCDVSNRDNVYEVAKKVQMEVGDVTILINNAGIMPTHPLLDHTKEEIEKIFDINVLAHFWTIQAFLPSMKKNNYGHLVALSSCAGIFGLSNLSPYCGSKFAVRGLMEGLLEELRGENYSINATIIFPYMTNTGLCKKPKIRFENLMPLLDPKDVAKAIMKAQRTNVLEASIPSYILSLNNFGRLLPIKGALILKDFIDSGVESDLQ